MPGVLATRPAADIVTRRAASGTGSRAGGIAVWALALLLLLFLAIPVGALVIRALGAGSAWDARTFDLLRQALGLSMATTAITMVIVVALGTPLAYLLARRRFPGAAAIEAKGGPPPLVGRGIERRRAFGVHCHVSHAGVLVDEQRLRPTLPAIG